MVLRKSERSRKKKPLKKVRKNEKKVLTFQIKGDRIYKSHGASAQAALNLENDTDKEITQKRDSNSE